MKIHRIVIRPVGMYGADRECWPTTKEIEARLGVMGAKMLRWMACISRSDRIRNDTVRDCFGVAPTADKMLEARLGWYGHILRDEDGSVRRIGLKIVATGKRLKGR